MSDPQKESRNLANHILPASANLLGICFLIFSLVHVNEKSEASVLDDFSALAVVVFLISCIFSYMSLRSNKSVLYERVADVAFILGLVILTVAASLLTAHYIK